MQINKSQVIEQLAVRNGITATESEKFLNNFINYIYHELSRDNVVNLSGFGRFSVSHRASRIGVNPRKPTERITIPALNTPKFRAGEAFKYEVRLR